MIQILLPDAVSRDALDDLAAETGLLLVNIVPAAEAHPAQRIYLTPDRRTQIHLVEGPGGALAYALRGESEAYWERVLRAHLSPPEAVS